jgi:hypothetical protein
MKYAEFARLHWSLFSSATWMPVSKLPFLQAQMHSLVKVNCPSLWLNVCVQSQPASALDDARWLKEKDKNQRINVVQNTGLNQENIFKQKFGEIT